MNPSILSTEPSGAPSTAAETDAKDPASGPSGGFVVSPNGLLQVVNEEKQFTKVLDAALSDVWNMGDCGTDYNAIAIVGSQSTGKSTILNRLFGTGFDVMDDRSRRQTTKGIWLGKARHDSKNLLVLDLEGTDGRERGEDQDFERKSTLFALALAEVVIINMWEMAVGLYNGANMSLLKTVLEVNLQLFQRESSPRTHLFFLIRDHSSSTPLESLAATIKEDLQNIWDSIASNSKGNRRNSAAFDAVKEHNPLPQDPLTASVLSNVTTETGCNDEADIVFVKHKESASQHGPTSLKISSLNTDKLNDSVSSSTGCISVPAKFDAFFDVTVASLPHMKLMRNDFDSSCASLRDRFFDKTHPLHVFRPEHSKSVPADGFSRFAESIWEKILTNRDLDLPTQQELLAQFRCDELGTAAVAQFAAGCTECAPKDYEVIESLGLTLDNICKKAISVFDKRAKRYSAAVYERKRIEVLESMRLRASSLFAAQVRNGHRIAVQNLRVALDSFSDDSDAPFFDVQLGALHSARDYFGDLLESSKMKDCTWDSFRPMKQLEVEMLAFYRQKKTELLEQRLRDICDKFNGSTSSRFDEMLNEQPKDVAKRILRDYHVVFQDCLRDFDVRIVNDIRPSRRLTLVTGLRLKANCVRSFSKVLRAFVADRSLAVRLRSFFERKFRYDDDMVPRIWKPSHDMEGIYKRAREPPLAFIQQLASLELSQRLLFPNEDDLYGALAMSPSRDMLDSEEYPLSASVSTSRNVLPSSHSMSVRTHEGGFSLSSPTAATGGSSNNCLLANPLLEDEDGTTPEHVADAQSALKVAIEQLTRLPEELRPSLGAVSAQLKMEAESVYVDAKRAVVAQTSSVPWWVLVMIAILGWNEFVYLLSSPIVLIFVIMLGALSTVLYATGMLWPAYTVSTRVFKETLRQISLQLSGTGSSSSNLHVIENRRGVGRDLKVNPPRGEYELDDLSSNSQRMSSQSSLNSVSSK